MFYSQCLLSKKGPLGTIWVAAHCHKRLKKEQVYQTNISSSVDKILLDEVPVVTYRILGYLLLGVVRIYSKKVDFLFHDCRDVLSELRLFVVSKNAKAPREALCAPYSCITIPQRFELDTFDLEVIENSSRDHVTPREEIMVKDAGKHDGIGLHSFYENQFEKDASHFEGFSADYTPVKDIRSPYLIDADMVASTSQNLRISGPSREKRRGNRLFLEECLDPMILSGTEEEAEPVRPFDEEQQIDGEQIKFPVTMLGDDGDPEDNITSFVEGEHAEAKQTKLSEMTSLESEKIQITSTKHPVSITVDVTPDSKFPNASGGTTPEFIAVRTPATKEHNILKKRKCLLDDMLVIPNKILKQSIYDASDLVRKRRKAPHSVLSSWKAHQISSLPHGFLESLIPCVSIDFRSMICQKQESTEYVETPSKIDGLEFPAADKPHEEELIAPSTPVTQFRYNDIRGVPSLERVGPVSSFESMEKELSRNEDQEFESSLMNEELNSCERDHQDKNNWSVRTRFVARYVHNKFLNRKEQGQDEVVNLSTFLKGKTKKESARLFYELLVLKTGGFLDVKQNIAYDDITVSETSKLKDACEEANGAQDR